MESYSLLHILTQKDWILELQEVDLFYPFLKYLTSFKIRIDKIKSNYKQEINLIKKIKTSFSNFRNLNIFYQDER